MRLGATRWGGSASDDVQVTVDTTANHVPAVLGDFAATTPNVAVQFNVLANDSDADGDTLTVIAFGQGASGAVACSANGTCTYTPNASFTGQDTFTYTASDGNGGQAIGTVTVDVVGADQTANAPPLKVQ